MSFDSTRLILLCGVATLCAAADNAPLGIATRNNIATHAGPLPAYSGVPMEASSAQLTARAVRAYRDGKVKPLFLTRFSGVGGQGGIEAAGGGGGSTAPAGGSGGPGTPQ